ncbi:MAG TPA: trypsin-like peptidase domain-containing protein [Pirellulaceae bacterium]|nr:trypsin-like peptidase domain-containing protein [Pirellulaceae bacterium]
MTTGWRNWTRKLGLGTLLAAAIAAPLAPWSSPILAADANMPVAAAADAVKERLSRIFSGRESPASVDDLRLIEQRVRELTDKLQACTVGVQVGHAWGSGVIVSKDGYVLTAAHVCGQPGRDARFMLSDGRILRGKTLGLFRTVDAGLMKITEQIKEGELPSAEMAQAKAINEHQWCLATGHPGGYQDDRKPVLRLGRVWVLDENKAITTDCTLVGGDSGGPLFDMDGHVIGINSRIGPKLTSNIHVPVNAYRDNWDRMVKEEAWGHLDGHEPYIGIRGEDGVTEAKIATVIANSPADKVGLKMGDIIVSINGQQVAEFKAFRDYIQEKQPGDKVKLQVRRGEETLDFNVVLTRRRG